MSSATTGGGSQGSSLSNAGERPTARTPQSAHTDAILANASSSQTTTTTAIASARGVEADVSTQPTGDLTTSTMAASAQADSSSFLSTTGVPMQEMIDSISATIELAARQGIAHARIELQPEDLGHISIRVSQTAEGLSARVTADTPAGAQALTQGHSELRQSLSSLGVSLLRLDIGAHGQPQAREHDQRFSERPDGSNASTTGLASEEDDTDGPLAGGSQPAGGALGEIVDVLA